MGFFSVIFMLEIKLCLIYLFYLYILLYIYHIQGPPKKKTYTHFNRWYLCIVFEQIFSTDVATRITVNSRDV
jgi:hypothetical protein